MATGIETADIARSSADPLYDPVLGATDRLFDLLPIAAYVCVADGRIVRFNRRAAELWGRTPKVGDPAERFCGSHRLRRADGAPLPHAECPMAEVLRTGISVRDQEVVVERPDGSRVVALVNIDALKDGAGKIVGAVNCFDDRTERKRVEEETRASGAVAREQALSLETINRINLSLAAELDVERLVQAVTDAATELVGAAFGAFFYNVVNEQGESYMLYTLSGAPRESFEKFPLPRNTAIFDPTFRGEGPVVLDDVTRDPRYGKNAPYRGMPEGHLPVRSYLAVPVVSRSKEVVGGLFFGHPEPGRFTQRDAENVSAVAVQAAIGFDNARAYQQAQKALEERERVERAVERLARIVESSDDAILSLDLDGVIVSWNKGAERLYGYSAGEAVGTPVTMLIPEGRRDEEGSILDRIRHGERIEHYETVRRRKDGFLLDVSLTVSPVQNADGRIVGASKIARNITERRRLQRHQELLLAELNHRVKNMLAVVAAIASQTARATTSMDEFREAFSGRLDALGRTYTLLTARQWQAAPLTEIVEDALQPHVDSGSERVRIAGRDLTVRPKATLTLGMILHELVTNASKYGALSVGRGRISVEWQVVTSGNGSEELHLRWREEGMAALRPPPKMGFGTWLIETSARHELGGAVNMSYHPHGLECELRFPRERLCGQDE